MNNSRTVVRKSMTQVHPCTGNETDDTLNHPYPIIGKARKDSSIGQVWNRVQGPETLR